jgi:hypothetical protein
MIAPTTPQKPMQTPPFLAIVSSNDSNVNLKHLCDNEMSFG